MKQEIAILMAAGLENRMLPLTESIPKPLVSVHGTPLIETMIHGLQKRNVNKIYIVVGYKKEQFHYLREKYCEVEIVENKEYSIKNNISSIYAVRNLLGENNCFICESDIYVKNSDIFLAELLSSCYYGKMVTGFSDDWIFETKNKRITKIKKGGADVYNMTGIAYLHKADARLLKNRINEIYDSPGSNQMFWDEVVDSLLKQLYMEIHEVEAEDLIEIDTIEELAAIDSNYLVNGKSGD